MDYDDNDFHSQNLHLAGEGSNKFSPALQPYALPKFDFDDSLHGSLRFDSLVETEVFLGIESNEDNQWIEDFSRGTSGIQFSSSAAESCSISRRNNVWSEATSSESVEMLLKSVGQEDSIPVQTNIKGSDDCDELGCMLKHMEPSLKQENSTLSKVEDLTNLHPKVLPGENLENFSVLDNDAGKQQSGVEDGSQDLKGDAPADGGLGPLGDLPAISIEVRQPAIAGSQIIDGNCDNQREVDNMVNKSLNNRAQEDSTLGTRDENMVASDLNIVTGNDDLNDKEDPDHKNETADDNKDILETETGENQGKEHVLSLEGHMEDQNPPSSAAEESMEEAHIIDTNRNLGEPSCVIPKGHYDLPEDLAIGHQSRVDTDVGSQMRIEENTTFERHDVEDNKKLVNECKESLTSAEDSKPSNLNVDGHNSINSEDNSSNAVESSSAGVVRETHVEGHVSSSTLDESLQICGENIVPVEKKDSSELASGDGSTENELPASTLQSDAAAGNKSESDVGCKHPNLVSCDALDGVRAPSRDGITIDAAIDQDIRISPLHGAGLTPVDKAKEIADKISVKASISDLKTSSQVIPGLDAVSESKKATSSGAAGQMLCEPVEQSLSMVDACNIESQSEPQLEPVNKDTQEFTKEMKMCPVTCDSTAKKGDDAEVLLKEHDETESPKVIEPTVNKNEILEPVSSARVECEQESSLKGQEENEAVTVSGDVSNEKIAIPLTNDCGSCADVDKAASGSPTVIRATELSQNKSHKEGAKCSLDQTAITDADNNKVFSVSQVPKENDTSKDERSFTFEVSPLSNLTQKESGNKWQPFFNIPATKLSPKVDGSPSASALVQIDPKIAQDLSHGKRKASEVGTVRSGSKGTTERKTRRSSGKATGKESAKKGNTVKETASVRLEKGEKISNVSRNPSGVSQHVQSNDMRYAHVDSSSVKPFVLASSTSSLPDLNSSASPSMLFQQPFTDLQQVQLRAQIFVYGALIQGTAPDEAYMISAFGGPDGGKGIWENALRSCIERLNGQKSHLSTPETPLQPRSGARAPDQANKQSAIQSKVISSPIGRTTSKGTPTTIVNPMVPLSSPLWSVPTPSGDTFQSSSMPRGPIMDLHRASSPLHPHQTPPIRNFAGNPWMSQAPYCAPWVASPQTSALDTSCRLPVQFPITEPVQLTPVKEFSKPLTAGSKHVSPGLAVQSGASTTVFTGASPVADAKKVPVLSSQPPTDPKPRKRKKTSVSETTGLNILHPHSQTVSVPGPAVTSNLSTPVAVATPIVFVSKAPTVTSTPSDIRKGTLNAEQRYILSDETLGKVKEARVQAEDAAALAAAAVSHSLDVWKQLDKQRNSGLLPDVETKLASAAVAVAAAAAVAKAAAAAANVASNAALQAKLMADEAVVSGGYSNPSQDNVVSVSEGMKNLGKATPASILKGDDGTSSSSSILVAARETARRRVEAASAAAKRAENMDSIVKAAELAAEAVSQAGKIVAMGDPLPLNELVAVGPEGYWRVAQLSSEMGSKSNDVAGEALKIDRGEGPNCSAVPGKRETQITNHGKSPAPTERSTEDQARLVDGFLKPAAASAKDSKGQKGRKAADLVRSVGLVPESDNSSKSSETIEENSIKEGSHVEVYKDGSGFKAAWFSATVLDLKDGSAYVSYNDLTLGEGSEKLKEWVSLKDGEKAPKIRIARPITAMPFEGTRKRRRAALADYSWSVGDRVDAWIQDSWWEGVISEKSMKDETMLTVHFQVQGETSVVRAWHLRPSLIWKDGEWIEWSSSRENIRSSNGGDTPQEKRPRVRSPAMDAKGKDNSSKGLDAVQTDKPAEPTLLDLSVHERLFNMGKSTRDGNKPDTLRMTRTGLQKEGSRVIFGVPKPGKKRKFMEVSKHYVADRSSKNNEADDSVKFAKYLMPQGSGSQGWKNTSKTESNDKQTAVSKTKVLKSGKQQNVPGRIIPQKNSSTSAVSVPEESAVTDHIAKTKASASHAENASGKQNLADFQPLPSSEGAAKGPILFSSLLPPDALSSKKKSTSNAKTERVSKGKLAPTDGKLGKIEEDKVFNGSTSKSISDSIEPRRSNRRIQPTSRLLEGLQSSLMVSKIPSVSHDKSHRSRSASRGNNQG